MDALMKLSRELQVVLVVAVVYVIFSFLHWQETAGLSAKEWDGAGVFAALFGVVLLLWEIARLLGARVGPGSLVTASISAILAFNVLFFTVAAIIAMSFLH